MSRFVLTAQLQLQAPNNVAQVVRQIQSQLNNVTVNLNIPNAAQAQRQLQQITTQTQAASSAADRMGRAFALSVRRFAAFSVATRAVTLFTSTLSKAIQTAIDFEREIVKISQVTGQSVAELRSLTSVVTELSTSLGVSSTSLIGVGRILSQAGFKADDLTTALKTLAKTELAPTFENINQTAEGAVAIFNQFGLGAEALEEQLGAVNAVAGKFAVEAGDLIGAVRRVGGVFKASGGNLNELLALFTSVRATTRESAESIATGLRTIFTRIQRPKTIEFLKQFGVELIDLEGKFVGPFEAVKRLSGALAGLGEGDLTFIRIAEELGGFRQIGKVLPLLQQFAVAQDALNAANKSGNSLTNDAATAQQALSVRITKVKEEFLALIRSVTETKTFQIMANTALSLASALIQIGEAIKPLLPLLAAVAAINFARGIGTFAGGLMRGMQSGRTYSTGGKVHHFARGGMVPGTGNRDTVPAMLQPGEFVIKKSSVNKLGASNLAGMNEGGSVPNRYAAGGIAKQNTVGMAIPDTITKEPYQPISGNATVSLIEILNAKTVFGKLNKNSINDLYRASSSSKFIPGKIPPSDLDAIAKKTLGFGSKTYKTLSEGVTQNDAQQFSNIVNSRAKQSIKLGAEDWANSVGVKLSPSSLSFADSFELPGGFKGSYFESVLDAFQGRPIGYQAAENNRPFDFTTGLKPMGTLFDQLASNGVQYIDAKISGGSNINQGEYSKKITNQTALDLIQDPAFTQQIQALSKQRIDQNKAAKAAQGRHFGGMIQKFATGGGVGTDTVTALLTPGEFVVNKKSAQTIGYGSLNIMNKIGKYASGGVVQGFNAGTSGTGVRSAGAKGGDIPFQLIALPGLSKLDATAIAFDKLLFGALSKIGMPLENLARKLKGAETATQIYNREMIFINSVLGSAVVDFGKILAENNKANKRTTLQQMMLVTAIAEHINNLKSSGASQKQVRDAALRFAQHLDQNTAQLRTGTIPLAGAAAAAPAPQPPISGFASVSGTLGQSAGGGAIANNTAAINSNTTSQNSAAKSAMEVVAGNKLFAVSMASSLIQGFLPAADENSSALLRLTHSVLGLVTVATSFGFALQTLGISLSKTGIAAMIDSTISSFQNLNFNAIAGSITSLFSQTAATATNTASTVAQTAAINSNTAAQLSAGTKLAGGLQAAFIAVGLVTAGFYLLFSSIKESARIEKERAIKAGDVEAAGKAGAAEAAAGTRQLFSTVGAVIGGVVATGAALFSGVGAVGAGAAGAAGAAAGGGAGLVIADLFGFTEEAAFAGKLLAETSARFSNMNKALEKSSATAAVSLDQLNRGAITARDALDSVSAGTQVAVSLIDSAKATEEAAVAAANRRWFGRDAAVAKARSEGKERTAEARKKSEEQLRIIQPMLNRQMRTTAFEGGDFDDFITSLSDAEFKLLNSLDGGINNAYREFVNISKEIEIARKKFEALNMGLRSVSASADAAAVRMTNSMNSFDLATVPGVSAINTLSASLTAAGQNISQVEFDSALTQVSGILKEFGADAKQVTAFEDLNKGIAAAQRDFPSIFDELKANIEANEYRGMTPEAMGDEFKKLVAKSLDKAGIGDAAKERIIAAMGDVKIDEKDMQAILSGDMSSLEKYFGDAAEEVGKQIKEFGEKWVTANQELIKATQERIESERNFVSAQKEAINVMMEAREIQAKYGGAPISIEERRGAVLARANAGAASMGLGGMRTGSAAELRQRNAQILGGFASIESRRGQPGSEMGAKGAQLQGTQQNLIQAQKDQVQTIRELIKLEEEELKLIQEKNKLEKDSLDSLISGDIEKFFEQQASLGAQASIAAGNMDAANMFGAKAVADAFKDLQRQAEAGVQSLFGRQMQGPGGLLESGAGAALAGRGVTDPRMAQRLAGTTAEEEEFKFRIRDLASVLQEAAITGQAMAEMQVQTAQMKVEMAEINIANLDSGGVPVQGRANGGLIYANRGMFVPRGTDTVPAMLTPGEFVIRKEAVNRGNNLQLLRSINEGGNAGGLAAGGKVGYYNNGGRVQYKSGGGLLGNIAGALGIDPKVVTSLGNVFSTFVNGFNDSIKNLKETKLQVKLDSVNVNVNFTGTSVLTEISEKARSSIINEVVQKLQSGYGIRSDGKIGESRSLLPRGPGG